MMMFYKNMKELALTLSIVFIGSVAFAQTINYNQLGGQDLTQRVNTITTAVPFLMISPDSRAAGSGDAGAASSPDANSIHWNTSKLAFSEKQLGVSFSYTPWLRALNIPDINLLYLSGYYNYPSLGTFTSSLRYFSLGDIVFTDINGNTIGQFKPNEFAFDAGFARKMSNVFGMGAAVRYVNSNLTNGTFVDGSATRPGRSVAVDISGTYRNDKIKINKRNAIFTSALSITNIGSKMSYSDNNNATNQGSFLPINMRIGLGLTVDMDEYNKISIIADINKLLVPTPPIYEVDPTTGSTISNASGGYVIAEGKDPNRSIASGIFGSFSDAPGGGTEELHEFNYATGLEYWYNDLFAVRAGYFYEHPTKGARQYITLGAGVKYNVLGLDFAYLIPTAQSNPLANTLRFSLSFDFDAFSAQNKESKRVD